MKIFVEQRDKDYDQLDPNGELYSTPEYIEYDEILRICRDFSNNSSRPKPVNFKSFTYFQMSKTKGFSPTFK